MRLQLLVLLLRSAAGVLILRALLGILSNYPDYFPPNFDSDFLRDREDTFPGLYAVAFYVHIVTSPLVLVNGLLLLSETIRHKCGRWHRYLGRAQAIILLLFVLPSSVVMSWHAFAGWRAGISFVILSIVTATCTIKGVQHARVFHFEAHRRWMIRCYVLICSAVALRLTTGISEIMGVTEAEVAYILTAWSSWLIPLAVTEVYFKSQTLRSRCTQLRTH